MSGWSPYRPIAADRAGDRERIAMTCEVMDRSSGVVHGVGMTDEELHAAMPFTALLGATVAVAGAEEVRLRLEWDAGRCTAGGLLHGGALTGLADAAGGLCAHLNLPDGAAGTATISSATSFLCGVRDRHVDAVARPLNPAGP
jgi:1,4-dihydroxy-2-naphthoyl-CoA hydrolase